MERLGKLDVIKTTMQERYSRHILLKEIGEKGQEKIKQAKVLVVWCRRTGFPDSSLSGCCRNRNIGVYGR